MVLCALLGARLLYAPDFALQVANTQVLVGQSAIKLEKVSTELNQQAEVIKQKDAAYGQLLGAYQELLSQGVHSDSLDKAIEIAEEIPDIEDTSEIQQELSEVRSELLEIDGVE
ncbi:MAG: hypothetical protein AAFQ80_05480 [Cyanobacteria bacterium J06621_8]